MESNAPLREFILQKFKSVSECARRMDISSQAVNNWITSNPAGAYKHLEFWLDKGYTCEELVKAVRAQDNANFKKHGFRTFEA